jgi:hypothetical protein
LLGLGGANGLVFLLNAGNGVQQELGKIADGQRVAAVNTLAGELFDDVREQCVDAVGGVEIARPVSSRPKRRRLSARSGGTCFSLVGPHSHPSRRCSTAM